MNRSRHALLAGRAVPGAVLTSAAVDPTPLPNTAPRITRRWLPAAGAGPIGVTAGREAVRAPRRNGAGNAH
jgi:hypothetical protein